MEPTQELIDSIYRERVLRARAQTGDEKMLAGAQLFSVVCRRMTDGLRHEFPAASEQELQQALRDRLERLRRVAEVGLYRPAGDVP